MPLCLITINNSFFLLYFFCSAVAVAGRGFQQLSGRPLRRSIEIGADSVVAYAAAAQQWVGRAVGGGALPVACSESKGIIRNSQGNNYLN